MILMQQLLSPVTPADCSYIRCLGLNYKDHAKVSNPSPSPSLHLTNSTSRMKYVLKKANTNSKTPGRWFRPPTSPHSLHEAADRARGPVPSSRDDPARGAGRDERLRGRAVRRPGADGPRHPRGRGARLRAGLHGVQRRVGAQAAADDGAVVLWERS
jgi:hypothetical protein